MGKQDDFHLENLMKCRKTNKNLTLEFSITVWPDPVGCHGQAEDAFVSERFEKA